MNYDKEIRDFIVSNFLYGDAGSLHEETSFLDSGVIDSTGILELVAFIEQKFQIKVLDQEMIPENLDSISRLSRFIDRKRAEVTAVNP
ncbi:MAG TPA: acyl carrier protein [Verrucomicrobiae bacterium]|nr:acyl carrier protein [Verrucomicrobiae bacterium]